MLEEMEEGSRATPPIMVWGLFIFGMFEDGVYRHALLTTALHKDRMPNLQSFSSAFFNCRFKLPLVAVGTIAGGLVRRAMGLETEKTPAKPEGSELRGCSVFHRSRRKKDAPWGRFFFRNDDTSGSIDHGGEAAKT